MRRLTREQVRSIDRLAVERYGIPGIVLMENAARAVSDMGWDMLHGQPGPVLILCGIGNNGGDGLAVARHLHNRGCDVTVSVLGDPASYGGDALINWNIVKAMNFRVIAFNSTEWGTWPKLIVDAVYGTGLNRAPPPEFAEMVEAVEDAAGLDTKVLAVDLPSGLMADTGETPGACIAAQRTVTFVAEKTGFTNPGARRWHLGQVFVAEIGCPRELVDEVAGTEQRAGFVSAAGVSAGSAASRPRIE